MCNPAFAENVPVPIYGAVPPDAVTTTFVDPPLQLITPEVTFATRLAEG